MKDRTGEIRSTRALKLREDQIEILSRYGQTKKTEAGHVLFRADDASGDFVVVLEGEVEVIDDFAGEARTMGVMRLGHFLGDLSMLTHYLPPYSPKCVEQEFSEVPTILSLLSEEGASLDISPVSRARHYYWVS